VGHPLPAQAPPGNCRSLRTWLASSVLLIFPVPRSPRTGHLTAGGPGDVLIGGTTDYDTNVAALSLLLAEWSNPADGYATRVSRLLGPGQPGGAAGGLNGSFFLNPTTVHDDGAADLLAGGGGMDWFFASAAGQDLLLNRRKGEVVTLIP
jgi:hypothetical protein